MLPFYDPRHFCKSTWTFESQIKDAKFKVSSEGIQYAEITVKGKTGSRILLLIDSIPYIKEWILSHPEGHNPDSWLFIYNHSCKYYDIESYEVILSNLLDCYEEHNKDKYWFNTNTTTMNR